MGGLEGHLHNRVVSEEYQWLVDEEGEIAFRVTVRQTEKQFTQTLVSKLATSVSYSDCYSACKTVPLLIFASQVTKGPETDVTSFPVPQYTLSPPMKSPAIQ